MMKRVVAISFVVISGVGLIQCAPTAYKYECSKIQSAIGSIKPRDIISASTGETVRGNVRDQYGVGIPGAIVAFKDQASKEVFASVTDIAGNYCIQAVPPCKDGILYFEAPGFHCNVVRHISVFEKMPTVISTTLYEIHQVGTVEVE